MKCFKCDEVMDEISFPVCDTCGPKDRDSQVVLTPFKGLQERASLYACTSRDCGNVGIVMVIPHESKDED